MIRPRRGLGFTYWDLAAAVPMESCSVYDSNCVGRNAQRNTAVNTLWQSWVGKPASFFEGPLPAVSVQVDNSQAAFDSFWNNTPVTSQSISVAGAAPVVVSQLPAMTMPDSTTPAGARVVQSSGVPESSGGGTLPTIGGFNLNQIPAWGWAVGVGALVFFLKGR